MASLKQTFSLPALSHTRALARNLAAAVAEYQRLHPAEPLPVILLMGDLGAGKTTLIRFLVEALPGGENAEVASPSFTLCNVYPTTPKVQHFDLYRLPPGSVLVATLEPCLMCLGAAVHARLGGLVFGARDPKSGAVESCLDGLSLPFLNHRLPFLGGVRAEKCAGLLTAFFKARR